MDRSRDIQAGGGDAARRVRAFAVPFVVCAFAAVAYWASLGTAVMPGSSGHGLGTMTFPRMVLGLMVGLSILIAVTSKPEKQAPLDRKFWPILICLVLMTLLLNVLGFYVFCVGAIFVLGYLWGEKNLLRLLLVGVAFAACIYFILERVLGTRFPASKLLAWIGW